MKPAGSVAPSGMTGAATMTPIGPLSRSSGTGSEATDRFSVLARANIALRTWSWS